ncbi:energy transducer TonB [Zoogloea sp. LCSB751]|uniref:energy transducer TonB n=1 Tax=Zoogloea sp. LCSB751 TaxID=1965277 RepID=UPI0009A55AE8|nr:TonB family protein [Zoogloea sp. LCSB751]
MQALRRPPPPQPSTPSRAPPATGGGGAWPVFTGSTARYALEWGVGLSLALHAVLLSLHFVMPDADKLRHRDKGLEVVLVNSRHAERPEQADVLAQTNLDAGGTDGAEGRPSTPLPPLEQTRSGDSLVEAQRRSETPETPQSQAMTASRSRTALPVNNQQVSPTETPRPVSGYDLLDSSAAVARIEAQIDKDLVDYSARPRKKFIGARAQEYRFAQYAEDWRQKIERVGTLNYPDAARGKFYGSLLLSVTIRADGSVQSIDIHRSSGHKVLDDAARRIVQLAAPYAAFPPDIRRDTDVIEITRTWTFTNSDMLQTSAKKE